LRLYSLTAMGAQFFAHSLFNKANNIF